MRTSGLPRSAVAARWLALVVGVASAQARAEDRVEVARAARSEVIQKTFEAAHVAYPPDEVFFRVFKAEKQLELWARSGEKRFTLVKTYGICALSGTLGPKRRAGDLQVPEGFYRIDRFNPQSNFHLSLGVSYPNEADRILGQKGNLGGDIFVHGNCVTIGCIPLQDEPIEEVYLIALDTRAKGQRSIPIHIFPRRMDALGMVKLAEDAEGQPELLEFWKSLEPGYRVFQTSQRLPVVQVSPTGKYLLRGGT